MKELSETYVDADTNVDWEIKVECSDSLLLIFLTEIVAMLGIEAEAEEMEEEEVVENLCENENGSRYTSLKSKSLSAVGNILLLPLVPLLSLLDLPLTLLLELELELLLLFRILSVMLLLMPLLLDRVGLLLLVTEDEVEEEDAEFSTSFSTFIFTSSTTSVSTSTSTSTSLFLSIDLRMFSIFILSYFNSHLMNRDRSQCMISLAQNFN